MAEKKFKTIDIKGKEYVEVNERVKYFIQNYKGYSIETDLLSNNGGVCVFKAVIKDENGRVISTGHAYEKESSSFINKTSYIENCETSAVGRALGFLGIGIDSSIASGDEVKNAIKNQKVDFNEIREQINKINNADELVKFWMGLKLSEKQASILKADFAKRKKELGGTDGVE
jgi:hypothetical protein